MSDSIRSMQLSRLLSCTHCLAASEAHIIWLSHHAGISDINSSMADWGCGMCPLGWQQQQQPAKGWQCMLLPSCIGRHAATKGARLTPWVPCFASLIPLGASSKGWAFRDSFTDRAGRGVSLSKGEAGAAVRCGRAASSSYVDWGDVPGVLPCT